MSNPTDIHSYKLDSAATHGQIAALGASARHATAATGANHAVGVIIQPGACAAGDIIDVAEGGTADVLLGGTIAVGDFVGSDATGKGVAATAGRVIGYALESGVAGDLIEVRLQPAVLGAAASVAADLEAATERVAALEAAIGHPADSEAEPPVEATGLYALLAAESAGDGGSGA